MEVIKKTGGNKKWLIIMAVVLVVAVTTSIVFYSKYNHLKSNPTAAADKETNDLVGRVDNLMTLPKDEKPTIATVQDKGKLKDQPFFADANNGDKLLIYTNAKKAIIYRPDANKVINVGPIVINNGETPEGTKKQ